MRVSGFLIGGTAGFSLMGLLGSIFGIAAGFGLGTLVTDSIAMAGGAGIVFAVIVGQLFDAFGKQVFESEADAVSSGSTWKAVLGWLILLIIATGALLVVGGFAL